NLGVRMLRAETLGALRPARENLRMFGDAGEVVIFGLVVDDGPPALAKLILAPDPFLSTGSLFGDQASTRGALGDDTLQRMAMNAQPSCRLRNIAAAELVDALDVLPAHAVIRHRILGELGDLARPGLQRRAYFVGVGGLGQVIDGAELHRVYGGRDVAVAG